MDRKILASEIEKEIKATAQVKWKDLDWKQQYLRIEELKEKYKFDRGISNDNAWPQVQMERDGSILFLTNWASIGAVDTKKVKEFMGQLNDVLSRLKKAADELKKEYPDVVIKGLN